MKSLLVSTIAIGSLWCVTAPPSLAVSLPSKVVLPLTQPYPPCAAENDSTTRCSDAADLVLISPWTFSHGVVEIDGGSINVRLDDLQLRTGRTCPTTPSNACRCWNSSSSGDNCTTYNDTTCSYPNDHCGPNGNNTADNNWATLNIYTQNRYEPYPPFYYDDAVRRDTCFTTATLDLVNTTNNKNHQINVSNVSSTGCGHSAPGDIFVPAEIRHVEILDSSGAVMAVMGVTP